METKDALDLLIKVSETTGKSWDIYYIVTAAILGFVATNREVLKNMKLRIVIMFIFVVFAIYSGISLKTFQERKIALWDYIYTSLNCEQNNMSRDIENPGYKTKYSDPKTMREVGNDPLVEYVQKIEPISAAKKVFIHLILDLLVLLAIFCIPTIRYRDNNAFSHPA